MKKYSILSCCFIAFVFTTARGQGLYDAPLEEKKQLAFVPNIFIGPGVGTNNISGMMGVLAELHVYKKITVAGGMGISYWGGKFSFQTRFYRRYPVGVFYGIGLSTSTGMKSYKMDLEVENKQDPVNVEMELHKVNCLNLSIGQHLKLGRRMRLNFELGYAIPLQADFYDIKTPDVQLTDASENQMALLAPGGLILGIALSLGLK
jgi:hypothetical protein